MLNINMTSDLDSIDCNIHEIENIIEKKPEIKNFPAPTIMSFNKSVIH